MNGDSIVNESDLLTILEEFEESKDKQGIVSIFDVLYVVGNMGSTVGNYLLPTYVPQSVIAEVDVYAPPVPGSADASAIGVGMTTYKLYLTPIANSINVYAIFGTTKFPLRFPASYRHHIGGLTAQSTNPIFVPLFPGLEYSSWLDIGDYNDYPGKSAIVAITDKGFSSFEGWPGGDKELIVKNAAIFRYQGEAAAWEPKHRTIIAQITVPTGSNWTATCNAQGKSVSGADWVQNNITWDSTMVQ